MNALLLLALAITQPQQAPRPPQGPPVVSEAIQAPKIANDIFPAYSELLLYETARKGHGLVTFVGVEPRKIPLVQVARANSLPGYTGPCIVLSQPHPDGQMYHLVTMHAETKDDAILRRFGLGGEVSRMADPFDKSSRRQELPAKRLIADDDDLAAGPWPKSLPKPHGMERYRPAKFTQALSRVGSFSSDAWNIEAVPRSKLEAKWQVPGGVEGVSGWRSDLYKFVAPGTKTSKGGIVVWNGGFWNYPGGAIVYEDGEKKKAMQTEHGHKREYADGTFFADVLSKDGKVFEVRYAEKQGGQWERYVAFKDPSARPEGYASLTTSSACIECHAKAGTGGYATGLVPGSDTVLSDPFHELENQR